MNCWYVSIQVPFLTKVWITHVTFKRLIYILRKNHMLMLVCILHPFKKGRRYSNEVINRKTPFWSQYQSLKRHEIFILEEKPYFDACLCSRSIQEGLETFCWSHKQKNTFLKSITKFEKTWGYSSWRKTIFWCIFVL